MKEVTAAIFLKDNKVLRMAVAALELEREMREWQREKRQR